MWTPRTPDRWRERGTRGARTTCSATTRVGRVRRARAPPVPRADAHRGRPPPSSRHHEHARVVARAHHVGDADLDVNYLARPAAAAQLGHQFVHLPEPGGTERLTLGE